jgi:hypothetical protein
LLFLPLAASVAKAVNFGNDVRTILLLIANPAALMPRVLHWGGEICWKGELNRGL